MVIKFILVFMVCQYNVYVIPRSLGRKDLGYKGYEPCFETWWPGFVLISGFASVSMAFDHTSNFDVMELSSLTMCRNDGASSTYPGQHGPAARNKKNLGANFGPDISALKERRRRSATAVQQILQQRCSSSATAVAKAVLLHRRSGGGGGDS